MNHSVESGQWKITNKHYTIILGATLQKKKKRMIEIWIEFARLKTTNQRLTDQVWIIIKNDWFSDLEILLIHQQIYRQTY